jgi:hypothetical protein
MPAGSPFTVSLAPHMQGTGPEAASAKTSITDQNIHARRTGAEGLQRANAGWICEVRF